MTLLDRLNLEITSGVGLDSASAKMLPIICKELNDYNNLEQEQIISYLIKLIKRKPLSSISLDRNEFIPFNGKPNYLQHKRTQDILMEKVTGKIFNACAYGLIIRHEYDNDLNAEIEKKSIDCDTMYSIELSAGTDETIKLYISKGGIITGDYIDKCYLRAKDKYLIRDSIKLPVSIINTKDDLLPIITIDYREPKLKALMDFYDCPIKNNGKKFNIRSYKKL